MSTALIELPDRIITDTGSVVAKHELLVTLALDGKDFSQIPFVAHRDVELYHHYNKTKDQARQWRPTEEPTGPFPSTFEWTIPDEYKTVDVTERCLDAIINHGFEDDPIYLKRLDQELTLMAEREMEPFFRTLIYIIDTMRSNGVVWGIGRGSSCASLILFLLGVNKVDPVPYDIPMEEFYK